MFIDRDASLIEFDRRVLEEARDHGHPLLERVKFLGILGRNVDEFVMVRGKEWMSSPRAPHLLRSIGALLRAGDRLLRRELVPALAAAGVRVTDYDQLTPDEQNAAARCFVESVLPAIAIVEIGDAPVHDICSAGLNVAVIVRGPREERRLAVVRIPDHIPSIVRFMPQGSDNGDGPFVWLEQLVLANLGQVFPGGWDVESAYRFRVLRDADVSPAEDDSIEAPDRMTRALRQRDTNPVMMMEVDRGADAETVERLARALSVTPDRIRRPRRVLDLKRLWDFSCIARPDLRDAPVTPRIPASVNGPCLFAAIRAGDILLHHPYESFEPVVAWLRQAAHDPGVVSISTTLYRTDRGASPVVAALADAARAGKHVRVLVELRARFDERHNAEWARVLRSAGVEVVHGRPGLKVHAKKTLVVRREGNRLRRYVHISTGNYSTFTALVYTDLALLTCDDDVAADVAAVFDFAAGAHNEPPSPGTVLASPFGLRNAFTAFVEREMAWASAGAHGRIVLKINALVDPAAIQLLCRASQAGVDVDLIVRGICCLRPGVPGVSERIRVRSIVGRFLEHSRAWYFRNGGSHDVFVGSADVMPRNFDRRIEVMVPLRDASLARRVRDILDLCLADTLGARTLGRDGRYARKSARSAAVGVSCQALLLDQAEVMATL